VKHVDLESSVGYTLKRAQSALHAAMDAALREHGLSVSQYSCLELLAQRPGVSNAELARGAFVTRQAMHQLLGGLRTAGLVASSGHGRHERLSLTPDGVERLTSASRAVARLEEQMLATFSAPHRHRLQAELSALADNLTTTVKDSV
jgi:DNA-binding MarR family transcriptional regulator